MAGSTSIREMITGLVMMSRPLILLCSFMAWLLGVSIATSGLWPVSWTPPAWGFTSMILVVASIHFTNEYADHETDALTTRTLYSGGSGVLSTTKIPRRIAIQAAVVSLITGAAIQTVAVVRGVHPPSALLVLLIGAFGGWMYSLPPLKLAWRGLGELDNALLGGTLLPLHAYLVTAGRFDGWVTLACTPFTLTVFANLLAVTWPDRDADAQVGKFTLATTWRRDGLRRLNAVSIFLCFSLLTVLWIFHLIPGAVFSASFASLPLLLWGVKTYTREEVSLGLILGMVAIMVFQSMAWFALGLGLI